MNLSTVLTLAATEPGRFETFLSGFQHLLGMLVVMLTLTILWGLCVLTGKIVNLLLPDQTAPALVPVAPAATAHAASPEMVAAIAAVLHERSSDKIPSEIVAVIAAAVHSAVGKDERVVAIRESDGNWERAARQAVFSSHRLR